MIQCEHCRYSVLEVYEDQVYYNCPLLQLEYITEWNNWDNCSHYEPLLKYYDLKSLTNTLEEKDKPPT